MSEVVDFFDEKRPWSKYKDGILDYYLHPYLAKVATIGRPITVVDCFAGAGKYNDGERGSPLIILDQLAVLQDRGVQVQGIFIEKVPVLYERLEAAVRPYGDLALTLPGDFHDQVPLLADRAQSQTVFVYADPIRPSHLRFDDLAAVYDALKTGSSVETLVNFLSTGFVRAAQGLLAEHEDDDLLPETGRKEKLVSIAGGDYWAPIVLSSLSQREKIDRVAAAYADSMRRWFRHVLHYPIREKYEDEQPKYHLVFGTRWYEAVDLMNRAMVMARRKFVGARFTTGFLIDTTPEDEIVEPEAIRALVVRVASAQGRTRWSDLRLAVTLAEPCMYTDAEINGAIKMAIQERTLRSTCSGSKIEEDAEVWHA